MRSHLTRSRELVLVAALSSGCAPSNASTPAFPDSAAFCAARAEVEVLRSAQRKPAKQTVKLTLRAPVMPQPLSARGAVAFSPPHDLRMILLGPGGGTALDLWMHDRAFRFEVPAIGRTVRGDDQTPPEKRRGLPVDFLRWWLLDPLGGEIIFANRTPSGLAVVLRKQLADTSSYYVDATIADSGRVDATRTTWTARGDKIDEERLHATSLGCGRVDYEQASTGLVVEAVCEASSTEVNPRAFVDPDAPKGGP